MQVQRAQTLLRTILSRQIPKRNYQGTGQVTTYNDLPNPQGSWQTNYDAQQRKYNSHLVLGAATLFGTLIAIKASGILYFNYNAPETPAESNSYSN